jgi:hypothetical protein
MSTMPNAAMILSQFPGPVTLYPSKRKWILILIIGVLFTAAGHWMIGDGVRWGWFVFFVFACGSITAVLMLLPGAGALLLDKEGFQVTSLASTTARVAPPMSSAGIAPLQRMASSSNLPTEHFVDYSVVFTR